MYHTIIIIIAQPEYTNAKTIRHFVFSDDETIELECPLPLGRLHGIVTLYEFIWSLRLGGPDFPDVPLANINGTVGTFFLTDNNRSLQVQLPTLPPTVEYSLQCSGRIQRCNSTSSVNNRSCVPKDIEDSPFIDLVFIGK